MRIEFNVTAEEVFFALGRDWKLPDGIDFDWFKYDKPNFLFKINAVMNHQGSEEITIIIGTQEDAE